MKANATVKERVSQWQRQRLDDAKRKRAYMSDIPLPFRAQYGTHKAKRGDIYAVVVHSARNNPASPFIVKYYTIEKCCDGIFYSVPCDASGSKTSARRRLILHGKYTGYRKVA